MGTTTIIGIILVFIYLVFFAIYVYKEGYRNGYKKCDEIYRPAIDEVVKAAMKNKTEEEKDGE